MRVVGTQALVTGANRGLGRQLVAALLERGAERVYAAARSEHTLAGVVAEHGDRVVPIRLDVTDHDRLAEVAADLTDVDLLVSNAGRACVGPVLRDGADDEFRAALEVNFFGPLALVRALAPNLVARRGGVLFIGSLAALIVSRSSPIYSASKAAAWMLASGVRAELAPHGVTVTASMPGFIDTDMTAGADIPKASPRSVADRSLDALAAGEALVFPDLLAERVEQVLYTDMARVLTRPHEVMTGLIGSVPR